MCVRRCERVLAPISISAVPEDAKYIMHVFERSNHTGLSNMEHFPSF